MFITYNNKNLKLKLKLKTIWRVITMDNLEFNISTQVGLVLEKHGLDNSLIEIRRDMSDIFVNITSIMSTSFPSQQTRELFMDLRNAYPATYTISLI